MTAELEESFQLTSAMNGREEASVSSLRNGPIDRAVMRESTFLRSHVVRAIPTRDASSIHPHRGDCVEA